MMKVVLDALFGCSHRRTSFPLTPKGGRGIAGAHRRAYVACLDCGREFEYDWTTMKVDEPIERKRTEPVVKPAESLKAGVKLPGFLRLGNRIADKI